MRSLRKSIHWPLVSVWRSRVGLRSCGWVGLFPGQLVWPFYSMAWLFARRNQKQFCVPDALHCDFGDSGFRRIFGQASPFSIDHYAANRFPFMHQLEGIVDFFERHGVGNQVVDVDFSFHIPIDDLGNIRAAPRAAEGRTAPHPSRNQLERARGDFLAGSGHADDDALAPPAVAAFKCLPHGADVADALKRKVGAAGGQINDRLRDLIAADLIGIDEMRHAEFLGHGTLGWIGVDADNIVGANHARALDYVQTDAAEAEYGDVRAWPDLGGVDDGAHPCRHPAADVTDLVERCVFANPGERNLRQHGEIRKSRAAHVVKDRIAVASKAAGAIRHHALALGGAYGGAKI